MDSGLDWHYARAALEWQLELGADEAIGETAVDRFAAEIELQAAREAAAVAQAPARGGAMPPPKIDEGPDPVAVAQQAAAAAATLDDLREAMAAF